MRFNRGSYNRYLTYANPTDTVTSGSKSRTYATVFTGWGKIENAGSDTDLESKKRTTALDLTWLMPYNSAILVDGRFTDEDSKSHYVTGIEELYFRTELRVKTIQR